MEIMAERRVLIDSAQESDYVSELPLRSSVMRVKAGYWFRRVCFYSTFFTAGLIAARHPELISDISMWALVIHVLYYELDLLLEENRFLVRLIHTLSFVAAWTIAVSGAIFVAFINRGFHFTLCTQTHARNSNFAFFPRSLLFVR
jgi:hypothetical protein